MTPQNRGEIVARFFHASKQEAKEVAAELRPADGAPSRDVVTAVRHPAQGVDMVSAPATAPAMPEAMPDRPELIPGKNLVHPDEPAPKHDASKTAACSPRDEVEPLTAELRRLHVTVSKRLLEKLAAARDALSHHHPEASTADVLEAALDLLLARNARRKGLVEKPRQAPPRRSDRPRHIPASVKRAVWLRDGGRCRWKLASGEVCGATRRLELDHILPVALGGASTLDNLRLTCQAHNQLAARQIFGQAWIERCVSAPATRGAAPP